MRQFLRKGPPTVELSIVIAVAFGLPIVTSVIAFVGHTVAPAVTVVVDANSWLWSLLIYELPVTAVLFLFLKIRGWTLVGIGLRPALLDPFIGIGLAIVCYVAFYVSFVGVWLAVAFTRGHPMSMAQHFVPHGAFLAPAIAVSLVNAIYEEVFVCGYIVSAMERARWRSWTAINVSVAVRVTYHLYQGIIGVVTIVPIGLVFALWYWRSRRLWPAIVAHGVIEFIAFAWAYR